MTDFDRIIAALPTVFKWKGLIIKRGVRRAKVRCPYCKGWWHGTLNGHRNHLHMKCDGCDIQLME